MALGGEGLWCGSSLRPWQILHSRLARMHTCALLERDVWELMDETVEAAYPPSAYKKEEMQNIWDGDDGELWRHGGLMEARIRDWLTSRKEQQPQEAPIILHPYCNDVCSSATFSSEFNETRDSRLAGDSVYAFSEADVGDGDDDGAKAPRSIEFSDSWWADSMYLEEAVYGAVADALHSVIYNDEQEEGAEEEDGYIAANNVANAAILAAPLDAQTRYCQFSEDWRANEDQPGEREVEDELLCAVCLEKLYGNEELQALSIHNITQLQCRHSFHSQCLSPWLNASAVCPCCRAPIPLSMPLHLEAPLNVRLPTSGANSSDRVQVEMMGLVAEVEAALERFGLLS